jgi:hypothetical protein
MSGSGTGACLTRRRARLASFLVASGGAIHHRSDLVERHVEDIVQDEGQPSGGGE